MPRYFFDITNGHVNADTDGVVFKDPAEARREAVEAAISIFAEEGRAITSGGTMALRTLDETGKVICIVRLTVED